ncbi:MAG: hypothetical protein PW735_04385 [Acidobacteriaceae bacterium]|nr:hypothetical protein [Acidobacteriaceae bacterium]
MSLIAESTSANSSFLRHLPRMTARARALITVLNLHLAAAAALLLVVLFLIVHIVLQWSSLTVHDANALSSEKASLRAAQIAARPLRGLDAKVVKSTADADAFYAHRLPYAYSQVAAELGLLTKKADVRLTRVQYTQNPALSGKDALTEVRMDASVSGDYRPVVEFINALERDKTFFVIGGINLTGQQTGQVNLRIRLTTYLRTPNEEEMKKELAVPGTEADGKHAGGAQ